MAQITLNSTGVASDGALALQSNGTTTAVTIDTSQKVGIGTASPATTLHLRSAVCNVRLEDADTSAYANVGVDNSGSMYLQADPANSQASSTMYFSVDGTERMRIDSSGNVGIGTSSVVYQTQIYGAGQATAALTDAGSKGGSLFLNTPTVNAGDGGALLFGAGGATSATPFAAIKGLLTSGSGNTTGDLAFSTRATTGATALTERMRIDSSGNLLVGTTSTVGSGVVSVAYSAATSIGLGIKQTNSGVGTLVNFYNSAGTSQGYIYNNNNGTVSYANGSDYRLKSDIAALSGGLTQVMQLKPCTYKYIGHEQTVSGFIAHELAEVCPQAVVGEKDAVDAEGNPVYQGVDTSFLVATLTAAIQEQQAIITSLTDRITALEAK